MLKGKQVICISLFFLAFFQPAGARTFAKRQIRNDEITAEYQKTEAQYMVPGSLQNGSYPAAVKSFLLFLGEYKNSYKTAIYEKYFIDAGALFDSLQNTAQLLYKASLTGNTADTDRARLQVQQALAAWESLELSSLFWANGNYLTIIIILCSLIILFMFLVLLYALKLEKSKEREKDSSALNSQILAAQEEERARIARELHDTVAQDMRYTALLAGKINDEQLAKEIRDNQNRCISELRSMCYDLAPPDIDAGDFSSALEMLCGTFKTITKQDVRLTIPDDTNFSPFNREAKLNMYRIVQESLSNIQKHAQAHETTVFLRNGSNKKSLCIFITDDGCGMPPEQVSALNTEYGSVIMNDGKIHFGVRSIRKRVQILGGTVIFNSIQGEGTEISITIPYAI